MLFRLCVVVVLAHPCMKTVAPHTCKDRQSVLEVTNDSAKGHAQNASENTKATVDS